MSDLPVLTNPFAGTSLPEAAAARTDQQRAITEVQAALVVARANPRDPRVAMDRILQACQRQGLAEAAVYSYARGGTDITGPSIRLAETIAQAWGNLQFGIRELEQAQGVSTVQAYAWDVETNTRREVTFQVRHERHTRQGKTRLTDPRDIYETVANHGARRLRACVLAVIPGDVVDAAVRQCDETMRAKADVSPAGIAKMVEAFETLGVTRDQIELRIQRRLDSIQPAQVVALKKVWLSLRDGMSKIEDWFQIAASAPASAAEEPAEQVVEQSQGLGAQPEPVAEEEKQEKPKTKKPPRAKPTPAAEPKVEAAPPQAEAAAGGEPEVPLLQLESSTPCLLPWEGDVQAQQPGSTKLLPDGTFLQWTGVLWRRPTDQESVRSHVMDQLRRLLHHHFRQQKKERADALEWVREQLGIEAPPQSLSHLTLQSLVELVRKIEAGS